MTAVSRSLLMCAAALCGSLCSLTPGQEGKIPSADEVRLIQDAFRKERERLVQSGGDKRFLPILLQKADDMGKRGDEALKQGRLLQATELYRQARWQLPYQSPNVPEKHVARVLGNLRLRHSQEINDVAFSPDGKMLATASRDRTVKLWDLENGHELRTYYGHTDSVRRVIFSGDGRMIASAGAERDIKLWDPATGKDIRTIKGQGTYVTSIAFSRDGKTLVVANDDKAVRLYDTASGDLKRALDKHFNLIVQSVAFNAEGNVLAVGVGDGFLKLWQYPQVIADQNQPEYWAKQDLNGASSFVAFSPDGRTLARIGPDALKLYNTPLPGAPVFVSDARKEISPPLPSGKVHFKCLAFSKDSKTMYVGATDGLIYLYDTETGEGTGTFKGHNGEIRGLAFNATGSLLASASADYTVRLWGFDVVLQARDFPVHQDAVWAASFSPDGHRFATASADKNAKVVDVATGNVVYALPHQAGVTNVAYSPDGKLIATGGGDKIIKLWDAHTGQIVKSLGGHRATITCLDFTTDSKKLAAADADKQVRVWDVAAGKELVSVPDHPAIAAAVTFSPDGKWLATGNIDQTIRIHDADSGKPIATWSAHGVAVTGLSFSPNGQYLASCGADYLVRVWPVAGEKGVPPSLGTNPITLAGHNAPLSGVAFRKDSQHLVSCGGDMTVKLWKIENGAAKEAQTYRGHKDWVTSVAFSRDGYFVASASVDRSVKIWEITSREIPLLAEHTGAVQAVAVSPNGKLIASGGTDKTIKLWDRELGTEILTLHGHGAAIYSLAFTPDNKTLISAADERSVRLWDVATGKELPKQPGHQQNFQGLINSVPYLIVPDNKTLLIWVPVSERGSALSALDIATGDELFEFKDGTGTKEDSRHVVAASFSANGRRAATAGKNGSVRIWDLQNKGQRIGDDWFVFAKGTSLGDLALTPDGATLVVSSATGEVKILDVAKRATRHTLKAHNRQIAACLVTPDGKRFVTVGQDNTIKLFDVGTGEELRQWDLRGSQDRGTFVMNIAFTPDSRYLVTANANTSLFVLELP